MDAATTGGILVVSVFLIAMNAILWEELIKLKAPEEVYSYTQGRRYLIVALSLAFSGAALIGCSVFAIEHPQVHGVAYWAIGILAVLHVLSILGTIQMLRYFVRQPALFSCDTTTSDETPRESQFRR